MNYQFTKQLYDYQSYAITMAYDYMRTSPKANPCLVLPTGSGKSWIIAGICENIMRCTNGNAKILLLSHQKELLVQDAEKIVKAWPEAPIGIFCAGLKSREIDTITVASVQSLANHVDLLGHVDLTLVDEAHLIGSKTKRYKTVLDKLYSINPAMRIIGLTATPFRLDQGRLDEGDDALFTKCLEPISIDELIKLGRLAPLKSQFKKGDGHFTIDVSNVRTRGKNGDYIEADLEQAVNTHDINERIALESDRLGHDRKAWLFFCVSKQHARDMCTALQNRGIKAKFLLGDTKGRDSILEEFKRGDIQALTSVGVLTTGFDYPGIDMIVFARPTKSPGLYMQMAGRGMRISPETGKTNCLVLDFAGLVAMHGPITYVTPPPSPIKKCPSCGEFIKQELTKCPHCSYEFTKSCPDCDANLGPDIQECPNCEHEFTKQCQCGAWLDEEEEECPFCGKNIFYKTCPRCNTKVSFDQPVCPNCKYVFPKRGPRPRRKKMMGTRFNDDIMGKPQTIKIRSWCWNIRASKKSKIPMLVVNYYPDDLVASPVHEYLCVCHDGYPGRKAWQKLLDILNSAFSPPTLPSIKGIKPKQLELIANAMNKVAPPQSITYRSTNRNFAEVLKREWTNCDAAD